jgi:hypothetical protein
MTAPKMKRVSIEIEVPARRWNKYLKLFGGKKAFQIYWSAIAGDMLRNMDDDPLVREDYIRWAKATARKQGITPANDVIPIEWPASDQGKQTMELVNIFAKSERSPIGVVIESVVRDHLEALSEQVDEAPKAAKKLVAKWNKKSRYARAS